MRSATDLAHTLASGAGSIAVEGGAEAATISTYVVLGDQRLELGPEALAALREELPRVLPAPRHNLPDGDPAFRGREADDAALRAALEAGTGSQAVTALKGLGGIGKTELALRVARAVTPLYPAAQVLVDLRGTAAKPMSPQRAMEDLIHRFEPGAKLPEDEATVREIYRDLLRRHRSLLILDNARDTAQALPLMPPPPSAAIVTSRALLDLPGVAVRKLDQLARDEAVAVLAAHLSAHAPTGEQLDALAAACVDHALSLRVAGSYLSKRWERLGTEDYAARIVANRKTLEFHDEQGKTDVMAALDLSLQLLAAQDAELAERWRDLAVFPTDFDAAAAAAVWEQEDVAAALEMLEGLEDLGMVEPGMGRGRFRLHDLMHELARLGQPEERLEAPGLRHARHFLEVLAEADHSICAEDVVAALDAFDRNRANMETGQAWVAARLAQHAAIAEMASRYSDATVLDLRQHSRTRIDWLEAAAEAAKAIGDRARQGSALGDLGIAHARLGDARTAIGGKCSR